MAIKPVKANKVWAYLAKNKTATPAEVSKATGVSYAYVYKLMQRIGTPKEVFKAEGGVGRDFWPIFSSCVTGWPRF